MPENSTDSASRMIWDFEQFKAAHPIREDGRVWYMRFDPYWFAVGISREAVEVTQMKAWRGDLRNWLWRFYGTSR